MIIPSLGVFGFDYFLLKIAAIIPKITMRIEPAAKIGYPIHTQKATTANPLIPNPNPIQCPLCTSDFCASSTLFPNFGDGFVHSSPYPRSVPPYRVEFHHKPCKGLVEGVVP